MSENRINKEVEKDETMLDQEKEESIKTNVETPKPNFIVKFWNESKHIIIPVAITAGVGVIGFVIGKTIANKTGIEAAPVLEDDVTNLFEDEVNSEETDVVKTNGTELEDIDIDSYVENTEL